MNVIWSYCSHSWDAQITPNKKLIITESYIDIQKSTSIKQGASICSTYRKTLGVSMVKSFVKLTVCCYFKFRPHHRTQNSHCALLSIHYVFMSLIFFFTHTHTVFYFYKRYKQTDTKHCTWMTTTKATMIAITKHETHSYYVILFLKLFTMRLVHL